MKSLLAKRSTLSRAGILSGFLLFISFPGSIRAQEEKQPTIHEVKEKLETQIGDREGVRGIQVAFIDGEARILIHVYTTRARSRYASLAKSGQEGYRVHILYVPGRPPEKREKSSPKEENRAGGSVPDDRHTNIWGASVLDCNIIRLHLDLKPKRIRKIRKPVPCRLMKRSMVGTGGGHSFAYTKHGKTCPIRAGRVSRPKWADAFVSWVFEKGFTGVSRAGFLWPTELRASDKLWTKQSELDLLSRLPFIRTGAEWVRTEREKYGFGWEWEAPGTRDGRTPDTPTGKSPAAPEGD